MSTSQISYLLVRLHNPQMRENPGCGCREDFIVGKAQPLNHRGLIKGRFAPQLLVGNVISDCIAFEDISVLCLQCRDLEYKKDTNNVQQSVKSAKIIELITEAGRTEFFSASIVLRISATLQSQTRLCRRDKRQF